MKSVTPAILWLLINPKASQSEAAVGRAARLGIIFLISWGNLNNETCCWTQVIGLSLRKVVAYHLVLEFLFNHC